MKTLVRNTKPTSNAGKPSTFQAASRRTLSVRAGRFVGVWILVFGVSAATIPLDAATFSNPVLAGDFPDPSVIRVGDDYWATATTSEWAPLFPLLHSRDLVHWEHVGNVFERRPDWAVSSFWAPEIAEHKGKFFMYYVGRKRGGPLAVACATADNPRGPWTDHGPMVAQDAGSIDAVPVTDRDGSRWMIWKEDGNSRKLPTPLWMQKLSEDGTKLVGERKEILRNDTKWEGALIEGPFVQERNGYFYLFYSGAGCCGRGCNYALGVARATNLLGPWEKNPANPILDENAVWKCPGHGSIVTAKDGRDFLLYHAYARDTFIYVGRQGLLDEVTWGANGWPTINNGHGASTNRVVPLPAATLPPANDFADDFSGSKLKPQWQWPVNIEPQVDFAGGKLTLTASGGNDLFVGSVLGLKTVAGNYSATVKLDVSMLSAAHSAGVSAFGDRQNALGASVRDHRLVLWKRQQNKHENLSTNSFPAGNTLFLRMNASGGHRFTFSTSTDGRSWSPIAGNIDVEGNYLPPWDRGVRVALVVGGAGARGVFDDVRVSPGETK
jgi:xylan 1,4-beta-xylosidase